MGRKHKHSKDKLYKTVTELSSHHLGPDRDLELSSIQRRLKFNTCCLSLDEITKKPMGLCDEDNYCYVFECDNIVDFLEKFQVHPVTGQKVSVKDLFELKFHRNNENQYHCPVIYKLLNQHSKIIANKKSGHVYLHEAYHELNLKSNNFRDLLTDGLFDKDTDIVTIQDPALADSKWNVSDFHYVKHKLRLSDDDGGGSRIRDVGQSSTLKSSLDEYNSKADEIKDKFNKIIGVSKDCTNSKTSQQLKDNINSALYSDGVLSSSVTSTIAPEATNQCAALLSEEQILHPRIKKKGYVQILTNLGPINLELYCDRTPKTCHNFLLLCSRGYYDDTIFHRLIKNFILQGGDPTGLGTGGQSAWGEPFKDECHGDLKHEGRGVLAMANSGPGTNKSQFYITFKGVWPHLDGKHTVFGRVVGGYETLERLENEVEVDKNDRPKVEVRILRINKYVDPFEETQQAIECERAKDKRDANATTSPGVAPNKLAKRFRSGVGAYINLDQLVSNTPARRCDATTIQTSKRTIDDDELITSSGESMSSPLKKMNTSLSNRLAQVDGKRGNSRTLGDFSSW